MTSRQLSFSTRYRSARSDSNAARSVRAPTDIQAVIDPRASTAIIGIASQEEEQSDDGEYFEQLSGRITRVDLDASKRHVGFKVDGEGATIDATFTDKPSDEVMNSLLGEWAQIKGTVKYVGGQRNHIDIQEYNIVKQKQIEFAGQI
jgi:predicted RNA-binding protein